MAKTLYVIDGYYQIFRAFYGMPQSLTSPGGEPTAATQVFCSMLLALLRDKRPDYLAIAMDDRDETVFRREIDPNYKAHRDPAPEELHVQAGRITLILEAIGVPIYRVPGFEADDVMATIAEQLKSRKIDVFLVSRDKDLEQLITDRVRMYDSMKERVVDADSLLAEKGYPPGLAIELQTLVGDPTDNVPGIHGVGVKTAVKLLNQYGTARAVLDHAGELTPKMSERVRAFAEQIDVTRQLVTLRRDVPMEFDLDRADRGRLNLAAALPIFEELGFNRLPQQLLEMIGDGGKSRVAGFSLGDAGNPRAAGFSRRETFDFGDDSKASDEHRSTLASGVFARAEARGSGDVGRAEARGSESYELVDTAELLDDFAATLSEQSCFAFDTETTGVNPVAAGLVGMSFAWQAGQAYYIPIRAAIGAVLPLTDVVAKLKPVMEDPAVAKVGHNVKYDTVVLRQAGIQVRGISFDTMIAGFLLDPLRRSHSLDAMVQGLIGHKMIPITDLIGKGKNQTTLDQLDTARVGEYAAEDADFTWRLYELLSPQLAQSSVDELFRETEMPLVEVLAEMEHNGIALDTKLLAELGESMGQRMTELTQCVYEAAGHSFNIDSTKQLAAVLFDEQKLHVVRKTKTGRSTDADTLAFLAERTDNIIPKLLLEYRQLAKLKGTYVETLPKMICRRTGRLHASFNQTGAVTGRLSSSDPNLQNIPVRTATGRRIREAIVAEAGNVLLAADYSQIELRLLAHFCGDPSLVEAFRTGQDIHRAVAAQINGVAHDDVTPEQRSAAKAVNFGIIYGQSAFGLSRTLGIPAGEARAFIDAYFRKYPGIREFIDRCISDARSNGFVQTMLGRRRPVPELKSANRQQVSFGERIAVNTVVQGSAADLIKRAMIDIHNEYRCGNLSARMLIQVHDELVFEVSEQVVQREAEVIRSKMEHAMSLDVPIVVNAGWGKSWDQAK